MRTRVAVPMKISPAVAARTLEFLRRTIPRGHSEADELMDLIRFFERAQHDTKGRHRE